MGTPPLDSGNESAATGPGGSSPRTPPPVAESDADSHGTGTSKPSVVIEAKQEFDQEDDEEWRRQFYKTGTNNAILFSEGARVFNAPSEGASPEESATYDPNAKALSAIPNSSGGSDDDSAADGSAVRSSDSPRNEVLDTEDFPSLEEETDQRRVSPPPTASKAFVHQQLSDLNARQTSDADGDSTRSNDGSYEKQLEDEAAVASVTNREESQKADKAATVPAVASATVDPEVSVEANPEDRSNGRTESDATVGAQDAAEGKAKANSTVERGTTLKFDLPAHETPMPMTPRGGGRSPDSPSFEDEGDDENEEDIAAVSLDSDEHSYDILDAATAAAEQAAADAERVVAAAELSATEDLSAEEVNHSPVSAVVEQNDDASGHTAQPASADACASVDVVEDLIAAPANSDADSAAAAVNTEKGDNSASLQEPTSDVADNATLQVSGADDNSVPSDTRDAAGDARSEDDSLAGQTQQAGEKPHESSLATSSPSETKSLTVEEKGFDSTPPPKPKRVEDNDADLESTPQTQHTMVTASPDDTSSIIENDIDTPQQDSQIDGDSIVHSPTPSTTKSSTVLSPGGDEAQEMIREVLGSFDSFASSREIHANGVPGNTPKSGAAGGFSGTSGGGGGGGGGSGSGDDKNKNQDDNEKKSADAPAPPPDPEALARAAKTARKAREDAFVESCAAFAKSVLWGQ